jgi:hypothetical protein
VDPGPISIILLSPVYFTRTVYFTRILLLFSTRYAHNLCFKQTGEIDNLIESWEQSIWLCCVQVLHCYWPKTSQQVSLNGALVGVLLSQSASPSVVLCALLLNDKPWFLTEGKSAAIFITPSSWGSQRAGHSPRIKQQFSGAIAGDWRRRSSHINYTFPRQLGTSKQFSGAVAREEWKTSARGVFRTHIRYFVLLFCFTLFYLHRFISKTQKN